MTDIELQSQSDVRISSGEGLMDAAEKYNDELGEETQYVIEDGSQEASELSTQYEMNDGIQDGVKDDGTENGRSAVEQNQKNDKMNKFESSLTNMLVDTGGEDIAFRAGHRRRPLTGPSLNNVETHQPGTAFANAQPPGATSVPTAPNLPLTIPGTLRYKWLFWYHERRGAGADADWNPEPFTVLISSAEDLWGLLAHMKPVSELQDNLTLMLFRQGIQPKWEDQSFESRGSGRVTMSVSDRNSQDRQVAVIERFTDCLWLCLLMCMTGGCGFAKNHEDSIAGATITIRTMGKTPMAKAEIWISANDYADGDTIRTKFESYFWDHVNEFEKQFGEEPSLLANRKILKLEFKTFDIGPSKGNRR